MGSSSSNKKKVRNQKIKKSTGIKGKKVKKLNIQIR